MWWINLFVVGGMVSNKSYHAVVNLFGVTLDGFENT
jgi:hypothetical protein